jgi:hypothetical protein
MVKIKENLRYLSLTVRYYKKYHSRTLYFFGNLLIYVFLTGIFEETIGTWMICRLCIQREDSTRPASNLV